MKRSKKLLSLFLALVMFAVLAGCGGSPKEAGSSYAREESYDSGYSYGTNASAGTTMMAAQEAAAADYEVPMDAPAEAKVSGLGSSESQASRSPAVKSSSENSFR